MARKRKDKDTQKRKSVFAAFKPQDYRELEQYLNKMAADGWMLERLGNWQMVFLKEKPAARRFSVDIFTDTEGADRPVSEGALSYRECCEESGWTFVDGFRNIQVFCAPKDSSPVPIQTDEKLQQQILRRCEWKELGAALLRLLCSCFWLLLFFSVYQFLTRNVWLVLAGVIAAETVWAAAEVSGAAVRLIRSRLNIQGRIRNVNRLIARRIGSRIAGILLLLGCFYVLTADFTIQQEKGRWIFGTLLPVFGGIAVGGIVQWRANRSRQPRETRDSGIAVGIVALIFITIVSKAFYDSLTEKRPPKITQEYAYPVISAKQSGGNIMRINETKSSSLLIPEYYEYTEFSDLYFGLNLILLDAASENTAKWIGNYMQAYSDMDPLAGMDELLTYVYLFYTGAGLRKARETAELLDIGKWGCDEAYYWNEGSIYLRSGTKIVWIQCKRQPVLIKEQALEIAKQWFAEET